MRGTLLTTNNPKTLKGESNGFFTAILHLAPAYLSGFNVCPGASDGCRAACLNTAGHGGMFKAGSNTNVVQEARKRKTLYYFQNRTEFMADLVADVSKVIRTAHKHGMLPAIRLNGTSDIRWETVPCVRDGIEYPNIMMAFPYVQFYDYTKLWNRKDIPSNYHLTFSLSEDNDAFARKALDSGMNVAVVFRYWPNVFMNRLVVNGDKSDLRFLDPSNVIVGLSAKGRAKRDTTGFVR